MTVVQAPSTNPNESRATQAAGCCGGPAPARATACCARDADAKSAGGIGCGCSAVLAASTLKKISCCG